MSRAGLYIAVSFVLFASGPAGAGPEPAPRATPQPSPPASAELDSVTSTVLAGGDRPVGANHSRSRVSAPDDAAATAFAKLPISDVLAPAIAYAREGFPLTPVVARDWAKHMTGFDQEWVEPGVVDYREVYERPPGLCGPANAQHPREGSRSWVAACSRRATCRC